MSQNVYAELPRDRGNNPLQEFPTPRKALALNASDNNTASSIITLNDNTTILEVSAVGGGAALRWIPATETAAAPAGSVITLADGTANFDNTIAPNTVRRFAVPIENRGTPSIQGLNKQAGLYNRVAVKSYGIASVLTTQYT